MIIFRGERDASGSGRRRLPFLAGITLAAVFGLPACMPYDSLAVIPARADERAAPVFRLSPASPRTPAAREPQQLEPLGSDEALSLLDALRSGPAAERARAQRGLSAGRLPRDPSVTSRALEVYSRLPTEDARELVLRRLEATSREMLEASPDDPMVLFQVGVTLYYRAARPGDGRDTSKLLDEAIACLGKAAELSPGDNAAPALWSACCFEMKGGLHWNTDRKEAGRWYRRSRAIMQEFAEHDPARFQGQYLLVSVKYADTCWHTGKADEAKGIYATVEEQLGRAAERDASWQEAALALAAAHDVMGEAALADSGPDAAAQEFRAACDLAEACLALGLPHPLVGAAVHEGRRDLAHAHILKGDYHYNVTSPLCAYG